VKVARVVTGAADLYVHSGPGIKLWDTCGPEAILEAAGGRFTDLAGRAVDYDAHPDLGLADGIVATNSALHDAVVEAARATLG
jgi:3'(2'), 5'-bisphosphate nucleotidase